MANKKDDIKKSEEERKLDDNMKILRNLRRQHIVDINMVRVVISVWLVVAILASLPMLRPSYSEIEKRELKKY